MEGRNYVFFRNADDSAYMNMASNFRGVNHATENKVDVYFTSASNADAYDKIILSVADEKEKEACAAIAACLAGSKFDVMATVADDIASTYVDSNITAVDSITVEMMGTTKNVESVTANDVLTASDSGKFFIFQDAAAVLTLPDSGAGDIIGWTATFYSNFQATGQEVKNADTSNEKIIGSIIAPDSDGDGAPLAWNAKAADNYSSVEFTSVADGEPGRFFTLTNIAADVWAVSGVASQSGGSEATPFATS